MTEIEESSSPYASKLMRWLTQFSETSGIFSDASNNGESED